MAADPLAQPRLFLITGVMAAGKSTVARLLAEQLPRATHVRGDVFRRFIVSGRVEPTASMPPEAMRQLLLRYRLAMSVADDYVRAGFTTVLQDIVVGPVLADVIEMSTTRPLHLIVLDPDTDAVVERETRRSKHGYDQHWTPQDLVEGLRLSTPRLGLWLDTTRQTPADTVRAILDRLPESIIDPHRSADPRP